MPNTDPEHDVKNIIRSDLSRKLNSDIGNLYRNFVDLCMISDVPPHEIIGEVVCIFVSHLVHLETQAKLDHITVNECLAEARRVDNERKVKNES